jgi:hypothetical protein
MVEMAFLKRDVWFVGLALVGKDIVFRFIVEYIVA